MIRRILVLFALFSLTFMSAVSAHEHGMRHSGAQSAEATTTAPITLSAVTLVVDHQAAWLAAPEMPVCADARDGCHSHGKFTDCACPAACVGLFGIAALAAPLSAEDTAGTPVGAQRLFAMSSAPPTPPPRA